jgi:NAD(P)H-hydrate repair Nnr-like enzyme with NAD(P)H-hydrate dehydratase domain
VLSGVIGALLARGLAGLEAAAAGAWLHARAGALGPAEGLVASDLVDRLPAARAEVEG